MKHIKKFFENKEEDEIRDIFDIIHDSIDGSEILVKDLTERNEGISSISPRDYINLFITYNLKLTTYDMFDEFVIRQSNADIAGHKFKEEIIPPKWDSFSKLNSDIFSIRISKYFNLDTKRDVIIDYYKKNVLPSIEEVNDRIEDDYYFMWDTRVFDYQNSRPLLVFYFLYPKTDEYKTLNDGYIKETSTRFMIHKSIQ